MSFPAYTENVEKRAALGKDLKSIFDEAGPDRDLEKVKSVPGGPEAVLAKIQEKNTELDELVKDFKANIEPLYLASKAADENADLTEGEGTPIPASAPKSLGRQFVNSAAYGKKEAAATLDFPIFNTLFETVTNGWVPEPVRTGIVVLSAQRPAPHVVDFIPGLPTSANAIRFMEETTFTNNAAEAAEGAAYGEAVLDLTEKSQVVEKIAVSLPVTDEQLEDVDEAAAYIDSRLLFMIQQYLDGQVLVGDGTSNSLLGTASVSGINTTALGSDPVPDAIYKAFDEVRTVGFAQPNVLFINPADWQPVQLLKTADGQYIWGHPSQAGPAQIWGVPVVQTTAASAGTALSGDYANFSALYVKRGVDVQVTNAHSDFFTKGKQVVRADMRVAMVHYRASAFTSITGL